MTALGKEGDRSSVIIVSAWLNDILEHYLDSIFRQDKDVLRSLFNPGGILDSFSNKVKVAYLLGLFERTVFNDLNAIRKIRNDCAHFREKFSFRIETVKSVCNNLETIRVFNQFFITPVNLTKEKFLTAALIIFHYLMDMDRGTKRLELPPKHDDRLDFYGLYVEDRARAISMEIVGKATSKKLITNHKS